MLRDRGEAGPDALELLDTLQTLHARHSNQGVPAG